MKRARKIGWPTSPKILVLPDELDRG